MNNRTIKRIKPLSANIGILGVGHKPYWAQFDGLLDELKNKQAVFYSLVQRNEVNITDFGISDCAETAYALVPKILAANLDLLFIDMVTYSTSSSIAAIFREINIPMVLVALQPQEVMDYSNGSTYMQLLNDDICAIPEFTCVAQRLGRKVPHAIIGTLYGDENAVAEINEYCQIAKVLHSIKYARIGQMGHVLEAMLDMHTDPTLLTKTFGCHIVQTEPGEVLHLYKHAPDKDVEAYKDRILDFFDTPDPKSDPIIKKLTDEDLYTAARAGVALNQFIRSKNLD